MTGLKVEGAGVYRLSADAYHDDCAPGPSLSSSGARTLIEECPAAFWWNSYLNPAYQPEQKKSFDLGHAAHTALLEPDSWRERVVVIEAADYRTKAAQEARDGAWAEGKVPLLPEHRDTIFAMRDALLAHPLAARAWENGWAEPSFVWQDTETKAWLKCRPDFLPDHRRWIIDYKTTTSAHPRHFARRTAEHGYFQQAAWYIDGIGAVTGESPKEWFFVVQETKPPYLVSVFKLDQRAIDFGAAMNRRAIDLFAECVATGKWPGYAETATIVSLPSWVEFQLEERRELGEFRSKASAAMLRAAEEFQAP